MGRDSALNEARALKSALLAQGVPEVSIELRPGRPADGDVWNNQFVVSDFAHHTVSRFSSNNLTPCLAIVKAGRSDVPGPLCNGYGGWDLCARIITLGYANHAGEGGPMTVPSGKANPKSYTIPRDEARRWAFGWEFEGGLNEEDWSRKLVNPRNGKSMTFHEFMARCLNGTQVFYDLPLGAHAEHSTWTSRKIDRLRYTKQRGMDVMKSYRVSKKPVPHIDLSNVAHQFRIAIGVEEGKVARSLGVRRIQKQLNAKYRLKLKENGLVDKATTEAWAVHEKKVGGAGRIRVPDKKSLDALMPPGVIITP